MEVQRKGIDMVSIVTGTGNTGLSIKLIIFHNKEHFHRCELIPSLVCILWSSKFLGCQNLTPCYNAA